MRLAKLWTASRAFGIFFHVGKLSWILTLLAANGSVLAALLAASRGNIVANRLLATLVALISLRMLIYVMGFAGVYDDHPWITFAPLDLSLAYGPLLWLYVETLTRGQLQRHWTLHLAPACVQFAYQAIAFVLPLDTKLSWYRGAHLELVEPLALAALLISASLYLLAAWRRQQDYQRWLDERFADREPWRLGWLSLILIAFAAALAGAVVTVLANLAVGPLDYLSRTPLMIASSLLAYALGLIGWRNAALNLPPQKDVATHVPAPAVDPEKAGRAVASFRTWSERVREEGWWREAGVTIADIARRLAVSERSFSRGLSEGGGMTFNAFINAMRVEAIMDALAAGASGDLLGLALDHGFSSKASFNRAFLKHVGVTPSVWRAAASQKPPIEALA